jgi:hypothetical protein
MINFISLLLLSLYSRFTSNRITDYKPLESVNFDSVCDQLLDPALVHLTAAELIPMHRQTVMQLSFKVQYERHIRAELLQKKNILSIDYFRA